MTQEQKINELAEWLKANGISYYEPLKYNDPKHVSWYDRGVRLVIPEKRIAVVTCKPENENEAFQLLKKNYTKAFFVRDSEDMDFIEEKMQNCLKGWCTAKVRKEEAKKQRTEAHAKAKAEAERKAALEAAKKPKRKRIHFVRVENVRKPRL